MPVLELSVLGLHLPVKDAEALRGSMCVSGLTKPERQKLSLHQLLNCSSLLDRAHNPLSRFLSAASGSSSVRVKAEKMRLDSRRYLQKRASGRNAKSPPDPSSSTLSPLLHPLPRPATQELRTQPQETLPLPSC